jgi:hypothetical protein
MAGIPSFPLFEASGDLASRVANPIKAANAAYCFKGIMASTIFDATADGATL